MSVNNPRCPNCGGYKTESEGASGLIVVILLAILYVLFGIATYGIICLVGLPFLPLLKKEYDKAMNIKGYVCNICGYRWEP
jgi:hypothetical protein